MIKIIQSTLFLSCLLAGFCACTSNTENSKEQKVYVEVKFSADNTHKAKVDWKQGMTALEALQYVERVETYPVGEYVFVCKIDTAHNVKGEKAWYYKINGESAKKLAIWNELNAGDTLAWIYKQDICSGKKEKCD